MDGVRIGFISRYSVTWDVDVIVDLPTNEILYFND